MGLLLTRGMSQNLPQEILLDSVRAHGVIVIKNQNMTLAFTNMLGKVVVLPNSSEGQDPEPLEPAIQRITNFCANSTWKGNGIVALEATGTKMVNSGFDPNTMSCLFFTLKVPHLLVVKRVLPISGLCVC